MTATTAPFVRAKSLPTTTEDYMFAPLPTMPSLAWHHGQAAIVRWDPPAVVSEVRILLFRASSPNAVAIVADHVENNGLFVLPRMPLTLPPRDDYILRILSVDDSICFAIEA
ncbi:Aste57867_12226 [Aphanomyces stellatus]|uniref:Aste57867_12226 protein n=1 Tax=Aphanomyces stellatus TaxID=120398 RepID=A0A485KX09_9STRA|nr:hypothetical protein As57867_012181 [Aphanomyces stellatus]VFT89080.1 Aste57867_12226 [Aphanomyces stellatus]